MKTSTSLPSGLQVVLAYGSVSAACRATECLRMKRRADLDERTISLYPWSFGSLESPLFFSRAASNVRQAHMLVIAACAAHRPLSGVIERWLKTCLSQGHETLLTVMAIPEGHDRPPGTDTPWVESVQRLAVGSGCPFVAWDASAVIDSMLSA